MRDTGTLSGRAYFGFGASASGAISLVMAPNTGQFLIEDNTGYNFTVLGTATQTWQANHWYRMEVTWGTGGSIVGKLYDSDGVTLLNTVTATDTAVTSGAYRLSASGDNQLDTAQIGSGVSDLDYYSVSLTAGTAATFGTSTPAGGAGDFLNTLDPALTLFNSAGTQVATNDNGAADGRNALLTYTPTATGTYFLKVASTAAPAQWRVYLKHRQRSATQRPHRSHRSAASVGSVTVTSTSTSNSTITLFSGDPSRLSVPATVVLPAGQKTVSFPITVIDDSLLNGPETVSISASATAYLPATANVNVHDNETAVLSVNLPGDRHGG